MPRVLRYRDQICTEKDRDILFMQFNPKFVLEDDIDVDDIPIRKKTLEWLEDNNIEVEWCGPASNSGLISGYFGDFYIDVPYDEENPTYQKLQKYFEDENGELRPEFEDLAIFAYYKLEWAKELNYTEEDEDNYD